MDLATLRIQIDQLDEELVRLFCARMQLSAQVADYKASNGLPIYHPEREEAILQRLTQSNDIEMAPYIRALYSKIFEISRNYQNARTNGELQS